MQTPISFALEIVLDCETIEEARKLARKYIKDLERAPKTNQPNIVNTPRVIHGALQSPSTQRILDEMAVEAANLPAPVLPTVPRIPTAARIVGGEVNTGNGIKGPKKW